MNQYRDFCTLFCSGPYKKNDTVETKEQKENKSFSSKVFHSFLHFGGGKVCQNMAYNSFLLKLFYN